MDFLQSLHFLTQATFGPTMSDLQPLLAHGAGAWIDGQLALAPTLHRPAVQLLGNQPQHRQAVWWRRALTAPDQLRQRVAYALSQILVISDVPDNLGSDVHGCAEYYDILVRGAFGRYRDLLRNVALSPQMGKYLSHLQNAKANPTTGARPDENFAREIMQLFSIGLWRLNEDGTRAVPDTPTYTQQDITEMARVWTGWNYAGATSWWDWTANYLPMQPWAAFHDQGAKTVLGHQFPAGQGAWLDLDQAIDVLTEHPNCAPFLSRQLIQRLTTSRPSAGYVRRVAQVWRDTGGDLGEVVKAILLDTEGRVFGAKMREPLLVQTGLWRSIGATSVSGNWWFDHPDYVLSQAALRAPSVFNFFRPDTEPAPEYEILSHMTVLQMANHWYKCLYEPADIRVEHGLLQQLAGSPNVLLDYLNLSLRQGRLLPGERALLEQHLQQEPDLLTRARDAVYLMLSSPHAIVA